jgi:alpha-galactosidase
MKLFLRLTASIIGICLMSFSAFAIIKIETKNSVLILDGYVNKKVKLLYYGSQIENANDILLLSSQKADDAYSSFGAGTLQAALNVVHIDGNISTVLHYIEHRTFNISDNVKKTIVFLKDAYYPFFVELHYEAYFNEDIIKAWVEINHNEDGEIILEDYSSSSLPINNRANNYYLSYLHGTWGAEMSVVDEKLNVGNKTIESLGGIRSAFQHTPDFLGEGFNPSFMLSFDYPALENSGEVIGGTLAWTGAWKINFRLTEGNRLIINSGVNNIIGKRYLGKQEVFKTPPVLYTYSQSGKGQVSRNFHDWARDYGIRDGNKPRSILLNSWEGVYFNQEEDKLVEMMDGVSKIGGEMFVVDDGWFGSKYQRNDGAEGGLGDWVTDKRKLPDGISFLIKEAHKRNLKFGIWIEPEMVNEKSVLFETHPDWIIGSPHRDNKKVRNQYCLDLSNPEVQNFIFNVVDNLIKENPGLDYIKWDANRDFTDIGSNFLDNKYQSHLWKDYTDGLYTVLDRIINVHPDIEMQACSSGGGRVDFGILKYFHEFWTSDNTDALQRIFIQWGTSYFYPALATASHVTIVPNHQTGRDIPLKFRFDVAMSGRLGFELQPEDLSENEIQFARNAVETYKSIRPIIQQGDLFRLLSPYDNDFSSLMFVNKEKTKAVAFIYHIRKMVGDVCPRIKLEGLDANKNYKVREINKLQETIPAVNGGVYLMDHLNLKQNVFSGYVLRNIGIQPKLIGEYDSTVLLFEIAN